VQGKLLGIISMGLEVTGQLLIIFCIRQILEKKWEYNEAVHNLFAEVKKAYDTHSKETLYNILIEFWHSLETSNGNKNVSK
jgi:hypothetical protein